MTARAWILGIAVMAGLPSSGLGAQGTEPVMVTAVSTPGEFPAGLTGMSVTSLDGSRLRADGYLTLAEALRHVPGVFVSETGEFGGAKTTVTMRGSGEHQVLVMIDGVAVNELGSLDIAHLSLDNVERIDVVRGPAAAVVGPEAFGGVIHVLTRRGQGRGATVRLQQGTAGASLLGAEGAFGGATAGGAAAFSRLGSAGVVIAGENYVRQNAAASAHVSLRQGTRLAVSANRTLVHYRHAPGGAGIPSFGGEAPREDRIGLTNASVRVSHPVGRALLLEGRAAIHARSFLARDTFILFAPDGGQSQLFTESTRDWKRTAGMVRATLAVTPDLDLGVGVSLERLRGLDRAEQRDSAGGLRSTSETRMFPDQRSFFVDAVVHRGRATISGALRRDGYRKGPAFSTWNLGGVIGLTGRTSLRATAGRAGGVFSSAAVPFGTFFAPAVIAPEMSLNVEVGVDHQVRRGIGVGASLVHHRLEDIITLVPVPSQTGFFATQGNAGSASGTGMEITLSAAPLRAVVLQSFVAWLPMRIRESRVPPTLAFHRGGRLNARPDVTAGGSLAISAGRFARFRLQALHVGERNYFPDFDPFGPSGFEAARGYTTWDAGVQVTSGGITASLRVDNLFDADFETRSAGPLLGFLSVPGRGRTIIGGGSVAL